jgi:isopentenyl-diphosphate delta-isomerase
MENKASREADHPEEILDLVNERDEVIGSASRKEIYAQGLRNNRVIHAFIINDAGKFWIPRRVSTKKLYPDGLDYSIAGHVESGETYEEALIKEAREEVDLDVTKIAYKEIASLNPFTHTVHCFQKVYEIHKNEAPKFNHDDFSGYEWLSPVEIIKRFEAGEIGKEDIPEVVKLCYLS